MVDGPRAPAARAGEDGAERRPQTAKRRRRALIY
jgi:hypothetical protein